MTEEKKKEFKVVKEVGLSKHGQGRIAKDSKLDEKEKVNFILKVVKEYKRKIDLYQEELERESKFLQKKIEEKDNYMEEMDKKAIPESSQVRVFKAVSAEQERTHDIFSRVADFSLDTVELIEGIIKDGYKKESSDIQPQDQDNPNR